MRQTAVLTLHLLALGICAFSSFGEVAIPRRTPKIMAEDFAGLTERTGMVPAVPGSPSWHHRMYLESYRLYGQHDPRWDALAEKALLLDAEEMSCAAVVSQETIQHAYEAAMRAGCNDALILYRHARAKDRNESLDYMDRRILFTEAAIAMARSPYPAFVKCWSFVRAARYQPPPNGGLSITQRANMAILLDAVLALVPDLLKDEDMKPVEIGALVDYYSRAYRSRYGQKETGYERIFELFYDLAPEKKLVLLTLRANYFREFAWEARGTSYAYAISEDNWDLYGARLEEALNVLLEIWDLNPQDADIAAQIQQLYAQSCDGEAETWYQRAIQIDPGHYQARSIKLHFLQPKWCGSVEELVSFGRECYATERWDQRIPFLLVDAHMKAANAFSQSGRRAYLQQPEVWGDMRLVFDTYLSHHPDANWERSRFAFYATECGRWQEADGLLKDLGQEVNVRAFGGAAAYSNVLLTIAYNLRGDDIPETRVGPDVLAAISDGNIPAVIAYFDSGGRCEATDEKGRSLLWRAIRAEKPEIVRLVIQHGADVNERPNGGAPLIFAAVNTDDPAIVDLLIEGGANVNSWDEKREYNALTTAIKRRNPMMVEHLLERGARIDARDKRKNCALIKAAGLGFPEMVRLLAAHGADIESRNSWQYTALMTAATGRKKSVVEELIRLGVQIDAKTTLDTTAFANASYRGYADIMELLIDAGADINVVNKQENQTPLMYTADGGHVEACRLLLARGANRMLRDRYGRTAVDIARERGHNDIAMMIEQWRP